MRRWWAPSLRRRLAGWHVGVVGLVLAAYGAGVFAFLRGSLRGALDAQLHQDFEMVEQLLQRGADGHVQWRLAPHDEADLSRAIEVWDDAAVALSTGRDGITTGWPVPSPPSGYLYESRPGAAGAAWRLIVGSHVVGGRPVTIRVARSEATMRGELRQLAAILAVGWPMALGLAWVGGSLVARRALRPLDDMARRARTISADRLDERFAVHRAEDELGKLAVAFNEAFARLDDAFGRLKRFTADASHELRTPLTAMRSVGEVALSQRRDEATYRDTIGSMLEEADRLARLTDTLLTLTRSDGRGQRAAGRHVPLDDMARDVAALLAVLAEERGQTLVVDAPLPVHGDVDSALVRSALINLVDNAIKHGPSDSEIRIRVGAHPDGLELSVSDLGPPIDAAHREQVFERFFRVRSTGEEIGGLGLSIARWAVEAHRGRLEIVAPGGAGNTFRILLPPCTDGG